MEEIISTIASHLLDFGYIGIFLLMFLESSFIPFPSEVVMIPAGYFAAIGKMNLFIAIFSGIAGNIGGAILNYYLALAIGRPFLLKYGKYFFFKDITLYKVEDFFLRHGAVSTLIGRLIPVIRQYISIPAGLSKMNFVKFCIYTAIGSGIWTTILTIFGYFMGNNHELIIKYLPEIQIIAIVSVVILIALYICYCRCKGGRPLICCINGFGKKK